VIRESLSIEGLLARARTIFKKVSDGSIKIERKNPITLSDCLMSGLAMFNLKFPSLLQFDTDAQNDEVIKHNLKSLFGIKQIPSDTYMRERLDKVNPQEIRKLFTSIFADVQRSGLLAEFQFMDGFYLLSSDATGFFSSSDLSCDNCCIKEHRNGTKEYYHQILCGAIVHPNKKQVIPFSPEPIKKLDGASKNDCEFNATQRFISDFRREHPHLKVIFTADGLLSKAPVVLLLREAKMSFIIGAKPGDHKSLFAFVRPILKRHTYSAKDGSLHEYQYANNVPINSDNSGVEVNFLEYSETTKKGKTTKFSWITDIHLNEKNVHSIMQGGRARWKSENEVFNTLKNQNYHFEHNFGHGKKNLSTIFAMLMLLAFTMDQVQEISDSAFQKALEKQKRKKYLWERVRGLFTHYFVNSWADMWYALGIKKNASTLPSANTC